MTSDGARTSLREYDSPYKEKITFVGSGKKSTSGHHPEISSWQGAFRCPWRLPTHSPGAAGLTVPKASCYRSLQGLWSRMSPVASPGRESNCPLTATTPSLMVHKINELKSMTETLSHRSMWILSLHLVLSHDFWRFSESIIWQRILGIPYFIHYS